MPLITHKGGIMRRTIAAAVILAASLTACGNGDDVGSKPKAEDSSFDCTLQTSQAEWTKHCADKEREPAADANSKPMPLGKTVNTTGAQSIADDNTEGGAPLEITPTTILYVKKAMGDTAQNGVFAIVTVKDRAPEGAAAESALLESGGWQWVAPDGQAIDEGNGDASVTPEGFTGGGVIQAGTYQWDSVVFDLSEAQRGGTLLYVDGDHETFRWKVPNTDQGPELTKLKKGMEGNWG